MPSAIRTRGLVKALTAGLPLPPPRAEGLVTFRLNKAAAFNSISCVRCRRSAFVTFATSPRWSASRTRTVATGAGYTPRWTRRWSSATAISLLAPSPSSTKDDPVRSIRSFKSPNRAVSRCVGRVPFSRAYDSGRSFSIGLQKNNFHQS